MSVRFLQRPGVPCLRGIRLRQVGVGITLAAASFLLAHSGQAAGEYAVTVNGQAVHFDAIGPVQVSGRVLVPLRNVLDRAGAKVRWSPDSKILYARRGGMTLELPLGQPTAKVNGRSVRLEVPAMMMRGTIMVPLRFVTESLGATVQQSGSTIRISTRSEATKPTRTATRYSKPRITAPKDSASNDGVALSEGPVQPLPVAPAGVAPLPAPKPKPRPVSKPQPTVRSTRTTVVGSVLRINAEATPAVVSVQTEAGEQEYPLAPAAVVLCREGETGRARESKLSEVCPGDRVMGKLDATGKITILVAQYDQAEDAVASYTGETAVLNNGSSVTIKETTRVMLANGALGSATDVHPGDTVRVRLRPGSREATQVTVLQSTAEATTPAAQPTETPAAQPAETPAAQPATQPTATPVAAPAATPVAPDLKVTSFTHDAKAPLRAGNILTVTLVGEANAQATFDVGELAKDQAMQEVTPGTYVGKYAAPADVNAKISIFGKLTRDGKSSPLVQAGQPVVIDSVLATASDLAPGNESTVLEPQPEIYAVYEDKDGSGIDADAVKLVVAGEDVTTEATRTPRFITYRPVHPFANGPVTVRLTVPDHAGNTTEAVWQFNVNAPEVGISSVSHNATRPLDADQTVTVTVAGKPGGHATFDIGRLRVGLPLTETTPGIYEGHYTALRGDAALYARVVAHLVMDDGTQFTRECSEPLSILTVAPKAPSITAPLEGEVLDSAVIVTGKAQPGVTVRVQIVRMVRTLGLWSDKDVLAAHEVNVDSEGTFTTTKLTVPHKKADLVMVQAVAVDPAGHRSEVVSVKVKLQ